MQMQALVYKESKHYLIQLQFKPWEENSIIFAALVLSLSDTNKKGLRHTDTPEPPTKNVI